MSDRPTPTWTPPELVRASGNAELTFMNDCCRSPVVRIKALDTRNALVKLVQRKFASHG